MLPRINPTTTKAWKALKKHAEEMKLVNMKELFRQDPDRFKKYSYCFQDTVVDLSKNITSEETFELLLQLAAECKLKDGIEAMFNGDFINETEGRAVMHTALRNFSGEGVYSAGKNVMDDVRAVQQQMKTFCEKIHNGEWKGYTGKKIKYIVNIGIGGSDLGPYMVTEALRPYWIEGIQAYFVSNVDATH
ncbi:MAG TPA: hypothetical protein VM888_05555, partial [Chitinophagaceae bacterium]|nr:hypothetical protein [Chitinophagaceae bacterium]